MRTTASLVVLPTVWLRAAVVPREERSPRAKGYSYNWRAIDREDWNDVWKVQRWQVGFLVETKCVRSEVRTGCVLRVWVNLKQTNKKKTTKKTVITALRCTESLKHPFFWSTKVCVQRIRTFLYLKQLYMQTEDGFHTSEHRAVG